MNTAFVSLLLFAAAPDREWPGFLGAEARNSPPQLPTTWSPDALAWQTKLPGYGQSSPVIWGDKVFVTSVEGSMKETYHVLAVELESGKVLWRHSLDSTSKAENTNYVSRAAPTPVVDGDSVYVFFESGDFVALSHDGKERWKRSLANDYGKFTTRHGLSASPLQTEQGIVLLIDHEGPSYLLCVNKETGETLWKQDRKSRTSWSSPALVQINGKPVIVCSSTGSVDGYDPATGDLLWTFDQVGGNTSNTPLDFGSGRFLVGASAGREGGEGGKKSNLAMQIDFSDAKFTPQVLWTASTASSSFGSPIVHADHAYFVSRTGAVTCIDVKTGKERYTERLKQSCWATPLGLEDRIYFFGKEGHTTVIAAGPQFRVLAESDLWKAEAKPEAPKTEAPKAADAPKADGPRTGGRPAGPPESSGPVLYGYAVSEGVIVFRRGDRLYAVQR